MANVMNEIVQNHVGIFCVSKTYQSFPMWAHYADNAKGLVIEFKNLDAIFNDNETGVLNKLRKVDYYKGRRPSIKIGSSDQMEMLFSKHKDWRYEHEYRVVKVLSDCEPVKCSDGKERYYFTIKEPRKYIKYPRRMENCGWMLIVSQYSCTIIVIFIIDI